MSPRRPAARPVRLLVLLALLVLLFLLLELHQLLPGGWPGGGGPSGFRRLDVEAGTDPTRVRRPEGWKPDWQPKDGVTLSVRGPDGAAAEGWRVSVGEAGAPTGPERGGDRLLVPDRALTSQGFSLRWPGGVLSHGAPPAADPVPTWRVALPRQPVAARLAARPVKVEVRSGEGATPLAGARVRIEGEAEPRPTDAAGQVELAGLRGLTALTVEADGHQPRRAYAHPQAQGTLRVTLAPLQRLALDFVDARTGTGTPILAARLRSRDGRILWEAAREASARGVRLDAELAQSDLVGARLEVEAPGRPRTDLPLEATSRRVVLSDPGRALEVRARDVQGGPVRLLTARVRYDTPRGLELESPGVLEDLPAAADGTLALVAPAGGQALVVVQSGQHAPAALRIDPNDNAATRDVTLEAGVRVPVLVLDPRGRPVRDAEVLGRIVLDGIRVEVSARTDAEGRARVGPLPLGPCEILAHAPGRAWAAHAADAQAPMPPVELRLAPGEPLRLSVASPFGAPLEGVRVAAVPGDDGPADVEPPDARPWRTDASGTLVVPDLPLRPYRLRLELDGYLEETLEQVTPGPVWTFATLVPAPR